MSRTDNEGRAYVVTDPDHPLDVSVSLDAAGLEIKNDSGNPIPVVSGPRATTTATIANGGTTSGSVDLTTTALLGFIAPEPTTEMRISVMPNTYSQSNFHKPTGAIVHGR